MCILPLGYNRILDHSVFRADTPAWFPARLLQWHTFTRAQRHRRRYLTRMDWRGIHLLRPDKTLAAAQAQVWGEIVNIPEQELIKQIQSMPQKRRTDRHCRRVLSGRLTAPQRLACKTWTPSCGLQLNTYCSGAAGYKSTTGYKNIKVESIYL